MMSVNSQLSFIIRRSVVRLYAHIRYNELLLQVQNSLSLSPSLYSRVVVDQRTRPLLWFSKSMGFTTEMIGLTVNLGTST